MRPAAPGTSGAGRATTKRGDDERHQGGGSACGWSWQVSIAAAAFAVLPAAAGAVSYVSMGDSYTSGPGILPYAPTAPADCGQSELNYPHLVSDALKLSLTDVSCGGAKTANFKLAQYPDQPPQFEALSESTEVISVGMGGNDNNVFGTLLQGCSETDATGRRQGPV